MILMIAYTNYRRDPRVRRQAEALVEAGYRVVFLASQQPGEPDCETISGVEVIKLPGIKHRRVSMAGYLADYALFFVLTMGHLLRHPRRYRLVHVNNMPDFLVLAAWWQRLTGTPVIHDVHDLMPELYAEKFESGDTHWLVKVLKLQERWAGGFASAVLTVEQHLKEIISGRGIDARKIYVLMNLPDDRIFAQRPIAAKPESSRFVMVYHGTLARRLGLDIAMRAIARCRNDIPNLEFRIIGAGEERENLIALRDQLGLQALVNFSDGFVPVQTIPALIADADVGLIPLRRSSGTDIMLPTKLLEYVSVGITSIVPRTPTITRYFDEGMVEFFEAEDVASLADSMVRLYRDPARRLSLAAGAKTRFADVYRWSNHKLTYVNLVRGLIDRRR